MPKELITFGSRVTACDCLMVGRVNMVWRTPSLTAVGEDGRRPDEGQRGKTNPSAKPTSDLRPPTSVYFRVQFPPRSPFIGDWAVYRAGELALLIDRVKLTNINIVAIMRPKFPRFQT
jgi:hypothetical protein